MMKGELVEQPTCKSSDGELSACSHDLQVFEEGTRDVLLPGLPLTGRGRSCRQDESTSSMAVSPSTNANAKRRPLIILIAGITALVLVAGVATTIALVVKNKGSEGSKKSSSPFDVTDVPPTANATTGPTVAPTTAAPATTVGDESTLSPTGTTASPTALPTLPVTAAPTPLASHSPTRVPTLPTLEPTLVPGNEPDFQSLNETSDTLGTFCVIADVPYFDSETGPLTNQIASQMEGCEFLVHLGDIMEGGTACSDDQYTLAKDILMTSPIPTFIVPGDNEVRVLPMSHRVRFVGFPLLPHSLL